VKRHTGRWERPAEAPTIRTVSTTDDLTALAADFAGWHIWRGRSASGRETDWHATRKRCESGKRARLAAADAKGLRALLVHEEALVAA
jgi:hypothetical protein